MEKKVSYYSCIRCHAVSYCTTCDDVFEDTKIEFCPKCGKQLFIYDQNISHCLNQKKGVLQKPCNGKVVKSSYLVIHPDSKKKYFATLKVDHTCSCGNYEPSSISGVVNLNCRNCEGKQPSHVYKKMST